MRTRSRGIAAVKLWLSCDPVGTSWYADEIDGLRSVRVPRWGGVAWLMIVAPLASRYVVQAREPGLAGLALLCLVARSRRIVVLEFIRAAKSGHAAQIDRFVVHTLARAVHRFQVLTQFEVRQYAERYGIPADTFAFIEWPLRDDRKTLRTDGPAVGAPRAGSREVFSSGRASCDWPTLFKAAALASDWNLTVVCSGKEVDAVRKLNTVGAKIFADIPAGEHKRLLERCDVYVLCLRDDGISAGHIRLMSAIDSLKPVVATRVAGLYDYVEHMITAFEVPTEDPDALCAAVSELLDCDAVRTRLVESAEAATGDRTFSSYLTAVSGLCVRGASTGSISEQSGGSDASMSSRPLTR